MTWLFLLCLVKVLPDRYVYFLLFLTVILKILFQISHLWQLWSSSIWHLRWRAFWKLVILTPFWKLVVINRRDWRWGISGSVHLVNLRVNLMVNLMINLVKLVVNLHLFWGPLIPTSLIDWFIVNWLWWGTKFQWCKSDHGWGLTLRSEWGQVGSYPQGRWGWRGLWFDNRTCSIMIIRQMILSSFFFERVLSWNGILLLVITWWSHWSWLTFWPRNTDFYYRTCKIQ